MGVARGKRGAAAAAAAAVAADEVEMDAAATDEDADAGSGSEAGSASGEDDLEGLDADLREQLEEEAEALARFERPKRAKVVLTEDLAAAAVRLRFPKGVPWTVTCRVTGAGSTCAGVDGQNDLEREVAFYTQALAAFRTGKGELEKARVAWRRPDDYFAEMVKDDEHMRKVRERLKAEQESIAAAKQKREERESRKRAKEVMSQVAQEKVRQKKQQMLKVDDFRKKGIGRLVTDRQGGVDVQLDEDGVHGGMVRSRPRAPGKDLRGVHKGKKREAKDAKYGVKMSRPGDRKRNSSDSAADMSGYKRQDRSLPGNMKKRKPPGTTAGGKRPGKSRRMSSLGQKGSRKK